jgi:tetratricopeptide (TPR) repeat protein
MMAVTYLNLMRRLSLESDRIALETAKIQIHKITKVAMAAIKTWISYSHDSVENKQRVLQLSEYLRNKGIDCVIDQYERTDNGGFVHWMERNFQTVDFILLICNEEYEKRFNGLTEGEVGRGVRWEGQYVKKELYRNSEFARKLIPVVFYPADNKHVPTSISDLPTYDINSTNGLEDLVGHIQGNLNVARAPLGESVLVRRVRCDQLQKVSGAFFGRTKELALMSGAWHGTETSIVQFVAAGGTGKTRLLRHWIDQTELPNIFIAWSFYSQGSGADKLVSATPFFEYIIQAFKADQSRFSNEEDKGEYLAQLLCQQNCLIVLDGLEPLQFVGMGMQGELKDRALRAFIRAMSRQKNSLCVITTRLAIPELIGNPCVQTRELSNLELADGVLLLKSLKVHAGMADELADSQLERAVIEYGQHALALSLLGTMVHLYLGGNILLRYQLEELTGDFEVSISRHAFKVMKGYETRLVDSKGNPTVELALLYLLSLFDHPIDAEVLSVVTDAPLAGLFAAFAPKDWKRGIARLKDNYLLITASDDDAIVLDCHPLIREYFGQRIQTRLPDVAKAGHTCLYQYYRDLPEKRCAKFLPDTLAELEPLFHAVAHGCAAQLHSDVLTNLYWPRIRRERTNYLADRLGAHTDDLACLAHFFANPWAEIAVGLTQNDASFLYGMVFYRLRAMGRLSEALEANRESVTIALAIGNIAGAAAGAGNQSETHLLLGNIGEAIDWARRSVALARESKDLYEISTDLTTLADALHQAGRDDEALKCFIEAEQLLKEDDPQCTELYSLQGVRYCEFLLDTALGQSQVQAVLNRHEKWEQERSETDRPFEVGLQHYIAGKAYFQLNNLVLADSWFEKAIAVLRKANTTHHLAKALVARAKALSSIKDNDGAKKALDEALDIAIRTGLRLVREAAETETLSLAGLQEVDCE